MIEGDLDTSTTFPLFASPAVSAGFAAVFAFPLQHGQTPLGALGLYRDSPGLLSPQELRSAKTLADVAAAYLGLAVNLGGWGSGVSRGPACNSSRRGTDGDGVGWFRGL